ncbi:ABC transporter permease [Effusibacillus pohliae]|uniref:ABC transporter permease n=1 Tax=Effusibacillus pohliae TaxID=232270 RepID=UPI0003AA5FBD|nr:ABC transporter permease [Effusibacillus pohliae]
MNRIWAICWLEIRRVLYRPASYALMFGMPLIFTLLFGLLLGGAGPEKPRLALVDEDRSAVSDTVAKRLAQYEMLQVETAGLAEAEGLLHDKRIAGIVVIPQGYEQ